MQENTESTNDRNAEEEDEDEVSIYETFCCFLFTMFLLDLICY